MEFQIGLTPVVVKTTLFDKSWVTCGVAAGLMRRWVCSTSLGDRFGFLEVYRLLIATSGDRLTTPVFKAFVIILMSKQ